MALVTKDRVKETTTTTGTGTYSLAGASTGFQGFVAAIGTGNTCFYCVEDGTNWEVGIGTVTDATPDTLARTTILASSNAGAAVDWGAGTKNVFCTIPAVEIGSGAALLAGRAGGQTINGGTAASEALTLVSTSHATKGLINLGDKVYIDPNNGEILSLGHGSVSRPAYSFDISGNKAYGFWYLSAAIRVSINGAEVGKFMATGLSLAQSTTASTALIGFLLSIINRTSSVTETAESQGGVITNAGAGAGITSTLPTAVAGRHQDFIDNNASFRLTVKPNTGDQLIWTDGTVVSAATGSVVSTARYNSFRAIAVDTDTWVVVHATGTWTVTG